MSKYINPHDGKEVPPSQVYFRKDGKPFLLVLKDKEIIMTKRELIELKESEV